MWSQPFSHLGTRPWAPCQLKPKLRRNSRPNRRFPIDPVLVKRFSLRSIARTLRGPSVSLGSKRLFESLDRNVNRVSIGARGISIPSPIKVFTLRSKPPMRFGENIRRSTAARETLKDSGFRSLESLLRSDFVQTSRLWRLSQPGIGSG